jgi:hypothetical protein
VGGGLFGAGLFGAGLAGFAGDDFGFIVVVVEEFGLAPDGDAGGTVVVPELFALVRSSVPFVWTVNHAFAKPCPPACDREWSLWKK